jgi:uncharacterized protein
MKSSTINAHENTHADPPEECPGLLKALLYFNLVMLCLLGVSVVSSLKDIGGHYSLTGLVYAFVLLFLLAFAIPSPVRQRLRSISLVLLIVVGPIGAAIAGGYISDSISGDEGWGTISGFVVSYLLLAGYFVSRPKNRGCRLRLVTHGSLIYLGPFGAGLIGSGIGWYGFDTDEAIELGFVIMFFAYALPVNLVGALTQFGWAERLGVFRRVILRLSWCGVGLLALAVLGGVGYYLIGGWMGARAWAKHKAVGEADGWKYRMEDYIGEIPADDDNFFMAKPFNALLFTQELGGKTVYKNPKAQEELDALLDRGPRSVAGGLRRVSYDMVFPDWPGFAQRLPTKSSRRNQKREYQFFANEPPSGLSDEELIRHYFAQFDGLLSDLREAAKRPGHYFPIAYENGPDTNLPHLGKIKSVAQLLQYSALAKLHRGDVDGAMEDIRLQFRVFRASGAGLFTISQLVQIAIGGITVDTINKSLHTGMLSDAHLQELDRLLTLDKEYLGQMERAMQAERISMGPGAIEAYIHGADLDGLFSRRDNPGKLIPKGWHYQDLIFYDSTLKEYVSLIREAKESGRIQQLSVDVLFMKAMAEAAREWHIFSRTLLRANAKLLAKAGGLMNRFAIARLGVAIARHRLAKGSLPDNLDELVSTYIDAIPVDVLSGIPVAWERKGNHRYRVPSEDVWRSTWKYDPILAAIQMGDLDRLKKISDEGWVLTTPKPGEESRHKTALNVGRNRDPDPNYLGVPESVALAKQGALKQAIQSGNHKMVLWLIRNGVNIKQKDQQAATLLHNAARGNNYKLVKSLVRKGAEVGAVDRYGKTAIEYAQDRVARFLRDSGGIKESERKLTTRDLTMWGASEIGLIQIVRKHIKEGVSIDSHRPHDKYTPLMVAAQFGNLNTVRFFLGNKVELNRVSLDNETALDISYRFNQQEIVNELTKNGALRFPELNLRSAITIRSLSHVIEHIKNGTDLNERSALGETYLHKAVSLGNIPIVEALLEGGADINAIEIDGYTALDFAEEQKLIDLLRKHEGKTGEELKE